TTLFRSPHRVDGVVRDAEALHFDIADPEAGARLEGFEARRLYRAPVDRRRRQVRHVDHRAHVLAARQDGKPRNVIGVFVGDEEGGVARTPAGQHAEFYDGVVPEPSGYTQSP